MFACVAVCLQVYGCSCLQIIATVHIHSEYINMCYLSWPPCSLTWVYFCLPSSVRHILLQQSKDMSIAPDIFFFYQWLEATTQICTLIVTTCFQYLFVCLPVCQWDFTKNCFLKKGYPKTGPRSKLLEPIFSPSTALQTNSMTKKKVQTLPFQQFI